MRLNPNLNSVKRYLSCLFTSLPVHNQTESTPMFECEEEDHTTTPHSVRLKCRFNARLCVRSAKIPGSTVKITPSSRTDPTHFSLHH